MKTRHIITLRLISCLIMAISGVNFSLRAEDLNKKLKMDFYLHQARDKNLPSKQRLTFYDSVIAMNKDYSFVLEKGRLYESLCDFQQALCLYNSPNYDLEKISRVSLPLFLKTKMLTAVDYFIVDNWGDCIKTCYETIITPKPDSLLNYEIEAYRRLTYVYTDINNQTLATIALNKADSLLTIYKKSEAPQWEKDHIEGKLHMAHSHLALDKGDFSIAFDEEKKSREIFGDRVPQIHTSINLGYIYYEIGEPSIAENIFRDAITDTISDLEYEQTYLNYIETLHTVGKTKEADKLFKERRDILFKKLKNTIYEESFHDLDYSLAIALNDTSRALKALLKTRDLARTNYARYRSLYINQLNDSLEKQVLSGHRSEVTSEKQLTVRSIIILCILLGVTIVVLIYLGLRYWKLSKSSDEDSRLLEEYKKFIEDDKRKNEESLESRNRELMAMSMHMFQLNDSITQIERSASDSSLSQNELRSQIKSILKDLSSQEHVWEMFKIYFEDVNQKFFDTLYKINPELTKSELRMCAYIRAGMSSKEIAAATNRSVRTVDSIKYNLRKKLGIEESTDAFIRRITSETF